MATSKLIINNYPMYGLNHNRHFMNPVMCDCGCGQPMHIILETDEDVQDFCCSMLSEYECPESAIFAVFNDGHYMAVFKIQDEDGEPCKLVACNSDDMHMFAELDGEMRFCCYNLIIEEDDGCWMIQE